MKLLSACLIIVFLQSAVIGFCQKAGENQLVLSMSPGENNPRNSEGDFITLKSGRILFVYTHYTGTLVSDHAPAHLAGRYSDDGGRTWTKQDKLILESEGDMNIMSISLLRLQNGDIAMFYLRKNSITDCIPMMRISKDETKTWGKPVACISDRKGYFVLNNNRVIQLKSGRLLLAVAHHVPINDEFQHKATIYSYFSDDNGASWQSGSAVPNPAGIVTQEPGVVELKDGKILMFIRAEGGFQQYSYSSDQGKTWTAIQPSSIHSPISPASISRIPSSKDLMLVWNNNPVVEKAWHGGKRTPLTVAISKDEGKSWQQVKNIETDPEIWYCYTAIHFTKDGVLLGYCGDYITDKVGATISIRRLDLDWITAN